MKLRVSVAVLALFVGALVLQPAHAQQQRRGRDDQQRSRQRQAMADQRARGMQALTGQVVRAKRVDIRGTDRQNYVVLLKTQRGKRVVADLGPVNRLDRQLPRQGQRITVRGQFAQVGDRRVLFAQQLQAGGQTVRIERPRLHQVARGGQQRDRRGEAGLGVRLTDVQGTGVRVIRVVPGSPAARSGIRPGDVIRAVGGEQIRQPEQLVRQIRQKQPGAQVTLTVARDGQRREITARLASRQEALTAGMQQQGGRQERGGRQEQQRGGYR